MAAASMEVGGPFGGGAAVGEFGGDVGARWRTGRRGICETYEYANEG